MNRMQSGGWPYSKVGRDSSKAPSLRTAVLCAAVMDMVAKYGLAMWYNNYVPWQQLISCTMSKLFLSL